MPIANATEPYATLMEVTPQLATEWFKTRRRSKNRNLSRTNISQYEKDMLNGRWIINNDAIAFDTQGFLLNGHHRLMACINSGVAFRTFIHWNLPDESFITMDVNARRSIADSLMLKGVNFSTLIGPALNWWWRFHNNRLVGSSDATYQEQQTLYYSAQADIDDAAAFISELKLRGILNPSLALFCLLVFRKHDKAKADEFMKSLATGACLEETNPILLYRNILLKPRRKGENIPTTDLLAYALKTWNLVLANKPIKGLLLRKGETEELLKGAPLLYGSSVSTTVVS